ncbi:gem (nuclear organelle) associated protein 2 [Nowakowskiella sp. JEL0407]|nr:gem (nuclear organelle) associated protein 2 [Nowakowskiella sp. JEL0407]
MVKNKFEAEYEAKGLIQQALPIDDDQDESLPDSSAPPKSGAQAQASTFADVSYAAFTHEQLVQKQSAPTIVSEDFIEWRKEYFQNNNDSLSKLPVEMRPSEAWRSKFVKEFNNLQKEVVKFSEGFSGNGTALPKRDDLANWKRFCYSDPYSTNRPTIEHIAMMDQGKWLFMLLARLDPLLTADEVSVIRDLCRHLQKIRLSISDPVDFRISTINMLVAIISKCFGQHDLSDETTNVKHILVTKLPGGSNESKTKTDGKRNGNSDSLGDNKKLRKNEPAMDESIMKKDPSEPNPNVDDKGVGEEGEIEEGEISEEE